MRVVDRRFRQLFGQGGEFAAVVAGDRAKYAGESVRRIAREPLRNRLRVAARNLQNMPITRRSLVQRQKNRRRFGVAYDRIDLPMAEFLATIYPFGPLLNARSVQSLVLRMDSSPWIIRFDFTIPIAFKPVHCPLSGSQAISVSS